MKSLSSGSEQTAKTLYDARLLFLFLSFFIVVNNRLDSAASIATHGTNTFLLLLLFSTGHSRKFPAARQRPSLPFITYVRDVVYGGLCVLFVLADDIELSAVPAGDDEEEESSPHFLFRLFEGRMAGHVRACTY